MARPSKMTEATVQKLCDALTLGATYDLAAKYAGIGPSTLRAWRAAAAQAKPGTRAYRLLERLDAAESQAVLHWLEQIEQAAKEGAWQASAWRLERRYAQEDGRRVIQHDGQVHLTMQPEWQQLRTSIMQALAPYPEARAALAATLNGEHDTSYEHRNGSSNSTQH